MVNSPSRYGIMQITNDEYRLFIILHEFSWCWNCGRSSHSVPKGWGGPWLIERAHIASNPRRSDPRAVVALCSLCHRLSHGIVVVCDGGDLTPPSLANMLWLKKVFDPGRYDREFLQECYIGRLPRAAAPAADAREAYLSRRRAYPDGR